MSAESACCLCVHLPVAQEVINNALRHLPGQPALQHGGRHHTLPAQEVELPEHEGAHVRGDLPRLAAAPVVAVDAPIELLVEFRASLAHVRP